MSDNFCEHCGQDFDAAERLTAQEQAVSAALAADREAALRDVFAAAALGAIIMEEGASRFSDKRAWQAEHAYGYADAMLKARKC